MDAVTLVECLFLLLSNLALLPAIVLSFRYRLIPETSLMLVVFVASVLYHLCQVNFVCILDLQFKTLQFMDNFFVYSLLTWIILYFIGLNLADRFSIFIWFQILVFPLVLEFMNTWWLAALIIIFLIFVILFIILLIIRKLPRFHYGIFGVGMLLVLVGFGFHIIGGEPTQPKGEITPEGQHYAIYHSIWHILVMLGVYFAIDLKHGKSWIARRFNKLGRWIKNRKTTQKKKKPRKFIRMKPKREIMRL